MAPLTKTFTVRRPGRMVSTADGQRQDYDTVGELRGIMYGARTRELMLSQQLRYTATHVVAQKGAPKARLRDVLVLPAEDGGLELEDGAKHLVVEDVNDEAQLGVYTFYTCEERRP